MAETAGQDCAVCLHRLSEGDRRVRMMPCSHAFHQPCIFNWLKVNGTCPCCRFKLPTDEEQRLLDEQEAATTDGRLVSVPCAARPAIDARLLMARIALGSWRLYERKRIPLSFKLCRNMNCYSF
ncbi:hypothetical protein BAE44_0009657 [Dichanthelium oligosanthes]|uniref:RING-type domain-containing protein n=1 Tax=Dichanthelium oligosanthes TaxID=888268 RepID=A0A1E5VW49_9POAL|nr:hypothetical protein BAE44_0009657 [Dichanthelium oligosanthes]